MKRQNMIIVLLCIAALTGLFTISKPAQAQGNGRQPAATVIIGYKMDFVYVPNERGEQVYVEKGLIVKWADRSASAPEITIGASIAQVMASLQDIGFELLPQTERTEMIFNRPVSR